MTEAQRLWIEMVLIVIVLNVVDNGWVIALWSVVWVMTFVRLIAAMVVEVRQRV